MSRPSTSKPRGICSYYNTSRGCFAGNTCKFLHGEEEKLTPYDKAKTCVFYQRGYCARGDKCWFLHTRPEGGDSTEDICGICLEKPVTFGLLSNCSHIFCVDCMKQWRKPEGKPGEVVNSGANKNCPLCRIESKLIIASSQHFASGSEGKAEIVRTYKESMAKVPCRHFEKSKRSKKLFCPFGRDCFYRHTLDNGTPYRFPHGVDVYMRKRPPQSERETSSGPNFDQIIDLIDSDWAIQLAAALSNVTFRRNENTLPDPVLDTFNSIRSHLPRLVSRVSALESLLQENGTATALDSTLPQPAQHSTDVSALGTSLQSAEGESDDMPTLQSLSSSESSSEDESSGVDELVDGVPGDSDRGEGTSSGGPYEDPLTQDIVTLMSSSFSTDRALEAALLSRSGFMRTDQISTSADPSRPNTTDDEGEAHDDAPAGVETSQQADGLGEDDAGRCPPLSIHSQPSSPRSMSPPPSPHPISRTMTHAISAFSNIGHRDGDSLFIDLASEDGDCDGDDESSNWETDSSEPLGSGQASGDTFESPQLIRSMSAPALSTTQCPSGPTPTSVSQDNDTVTSHTAANAVACQQAIRRCRDGIEPKRP